MNSNTLLKLSLSFSLIGLLLVFFITQHTTQLNYNPRTNQLNREVKLRGRVVKYLDKGSYAYLTLEHLTQTEVVLFKDKQLSIAENSFVIVTGIIDNHNGKEQLIAYRLSIE